MISYDAIVIGAGVSGLISANRLVEQGHSVRVYESEASPGGLIQTQIEDGVTLEKGAATFLGSGPQLSQLAEALFEPHEILEPHPAAKQRFIAKSGRMIPVSANPLSILANPLVGFRQKLRIWGERRVPAADPDSDETLSDFMTRRFGSAGGLIAEAMAFGVYAGDPSKLSLRYSFPQIWQMEQSSGSLIRAALAGRKRAKGSHTPRRRFVSLSGGVGELTSRLALRLGDRLHLSSPVSAITRDGTGFAISSNGQSLRSRALVIATNAASAGKLLSGVSADSAKLLSQIEYSRLIVAHHLVEKGTWPTKLAGFGAIIPSTEGIPLIGSLWPGFVFPNQVPDQTVLVRNFLRADGNGMNLGDSDKDIIRLSVDAIMRYLKVHVRVIRSWVMRYPQAIPQPYVGFGPLREGIVAGLGSPGTLGLTGNYMSSGVALEAVADHAIRTADVLSAQLRRLEQ